MLKKLEALTTKHFINGVSFNWDICFLSLMIWLSIRHRWFLWFREQWRAVNQLRTDSSDSSLRVKYVQMSSELCVLSSSLFMHIFASLTEWYPMAVRGLCIHMCAVLCVCLQDCVSDPRDRRTAPGGHYAPSGDFRELYVPHISYGRDQTWPLGRCGEMIISYSNVSLPVVWV